MKYLLLNRLSLNLIKLFSIGIVFCLGVLVQAGSVSMVFEENTSNPYDGSSWRTSWVRTPSTLDGDLVFGYGSPAGTVYKWNGGDPIRFPLGGAFSEFSVDGDQILAAVNAASGTFKITSTMLDGETATTTEIVSDTKTLAKSSGLAPALFAQGANGKIAFNLQQGPSTGVDYFAHMYYDGAELVYMAESGESIPDSSRTFSTLTGFTLKISDDGENVAFIYEYTAPDFSEQYWALLEWDGTTLNNRLDSDSFTFFPSQVFYLGDQLYLYSGTNQQTGLFKVETNGTLTMIQEQGVAINGTEYKLYNKEVRVADGKIAMLGKTLGTFDNSDWAGFILHEDGSITLEWESKDFDFTGGDLLTRVNILGFDGTDMHLNVWAADNKFYFATTMNIGGQGGGSFWSAVSPVEGTTFKETGFGWIDDSQWPWIYHYEAGDWMWIDEAGSLEGFYAYLPATSTWIWSAEELGGAFYSFDESKFILGF